MFIYRYDGFTLILMDWVGCYSILNERDWNIFRNKYWLRKKVNFVSEKVYLSRLDKCESRHYIQINLRQIIETLESGESL